MTRNILPPLALEPTGAEVQAWIHEALKLATRGLSTETIAELVRLQGDVELALSLQDLMLAGQIEVTGHDESGEVLYGTRRD